MNFSTTPLLFIGLLGWTAWRVESLYRRGETDRGARRALWGLLIVLFLLGLVAIALGLSGLSGSAGFLGARPLYWYPFLPVVAAVTGMWLSPALARGLRNLVDRCGSGFLVRVHALRLLAVGGIAKAAQGEFTAPFAYVVGGLDLLFGVSALVLWWLAARRPLSRRLLIAWNGIGALVILGPLLFLGPWFMADPLFPALFAFPMLLAPAVIVPLLVGFNLLVAWRLVMDWAAAPANARIRPPSGSEPGHASARGCRHRSNGRGSVPH